MFLGILIWSSFITLKAFVIFGEVVNFVLLVVYLSINIFVGIINLLEILFILLVFYYFVRILNFDAIFILRAIAIEILVSNISMRNQLGRLWNVNTKGLLRSKWLLSQNRKYLLFLKNIPLLCSMRQWCLLFWLREEQNIEKLLVLCRKNAELSTTCSKFWRRLRYRLR